MASWRMVFSELIPGALEETSHRVVAITVTVAAAATMALQALIGG